MIKWLATALFLFAGTVLALNIDISKYGFLCFFAGHIMLAYYFLKERDWAMITQNTFFLFIDFIGIYRWFM